jgi:hypothetical protein
MSRSIARARAGRDRTSLYQEITDKIIAELEAGRVPWVQPWGTAAAKASLKMPKNAATRRHYSGINVLILWGAVIERGFSTQNWLTFRQALGLGGNVRKGEHGTTVVYADRFVSDEERKRAERDGDEPSAIRFLKRFAVFNTDQCEDLPREVVSAPSPVAEGLVVSPAEALIATTGADFRIAAIAPSTTPTMISSRCRGPTLISSPSTGTGRPCTSSVIGLARRKDSIVISPAASDRRSMPRRSWSPRSPAPSCVLRLASYQRCATPTILASGSKSCARMIALSFAPPALRQKRQTTYSRSAASPTNAR